MPGAIHRALCCLNLDSRQSGHSSNRSESRSVRSADLHVIQAELPPSSLSGRCCRARPRAAYGSLVPNGERPEWGREAEVRCHPAKRRFLAFSNSQAANSKDLPRTAVRRFILSPTRASFLHFHVFATGLLHTREHCCRCGVPRSIDRGAPSLPGHGLSSVRAPDGPVSEAKEKAHGKDCEKDPGRRRECC